MVYKGYTITITEHLTGYGWEVTDHDEVFAAMPKDNNGRTYKTEGEATRAAKAKVIQLERNGF